MHKLDRIFEADDIEAARLVEMIDHCGQRRRLSRTRGTGDEHHTLVVITELGDYRRHIQLLQCRHVAGNMPEHGTVASLLAEHVDSESPTFLGDVGKVEIVTATELFLLVVRQDLQDIALEFDVREFAKLDRHQVAVHPQHRRHTDRQVDIGAALCETEFQECVDSGHRVSLQSARALRSVRPSTGSVCSCRRTSPSR